MEKLFLKDLTKNCKAFKDLTRAHGLKAFSTKISFDEVLNLHKSTSTYSPVPFKTDAMVLKLTFFLHIGASFATWFLVGHLIRKILAWAWSLIGFKWKCKYYSLKLYNINFISKYIFLKIFYKINFSENTNKRKKIIETTWKFFPIVRIQYSLK